MPPYDTLSKIASTDFITTFAKVKQQIKREMGKSSFFKNATV
jgi:hypothetical protein